MLMSMRPVTFTLGHDGHTMSVALETESLRWSVLADCRSVDVALAPEASVEVCREFTALAAADPDESHGPKIGFPDPEAASGLMIHSGFWDKVWVGVWVPGDFARFCISGAEVKVAAQVLPIFVDRLRATSSTSA